MADTPQTNEKSLVERMREAYKDEGEMPEPCHDCPNRAGLGAEDEKPAAEAAPTIKMD